MSNPDVTTAVPSRTSIVVLAALTALVIAGTFWAATGPVFDGRHLVWFLVGILASVSLLLQVCSRISRRLEG